MADSIKVNSSAQQIAANYERYKEFFTQEKTNNLGQSEFLKLMTEQMKNQDFTNPTDNSEYIAQLAQFNSLQSMQQMTYNMNASFAASLVGKNVTMGGSDDSGSTQKETGVVSSVKFNGTSFDIVVNGKKFSTTNLLEISSGT